MLEYFIYSYGNQILLAALCAIFGALGLAVKKLATKYLDTETKRTVAKIVVQAVEQAWKALHGEDKMQKALEFAATLLRKYGVPFDADEMRIMIEAAVAEFNDAFNTTVLEGVAVEDLTDEQLRSLLQQCGFAYTENMTREEMLEALDEDKDTQAGLLT